MTSIARSLLLVVIVFFSNTLPGHSRSDQTPPNRAGNSSQPSQIVVIDAQVLSKKTYSFVDGLKTEDLVIYEDSTKRNLLEVRQQQKPLSLVILLDTSGSMRKLIGEISARLRPALRNLRPADEVALITFSQTAKVVRTFTSDRQSIIEDLLKIDETSVKGSTAIHEAVYQAAVYLSGASKGERQRAIVVITDNVSNESHSRSKKEVLSALSASKAIVCGLIVPGTVVSIDDIWIRPYRELRLRGNITTYADETGGIVFGIDERETQTKLEAMMDYLRNHYWISYESHNPKPHKIDVQPSPDAEERLGKILITARVAYRLTR